MTKKDELLLSFFHTEPEPDLFWDSIPYKKKHEYVVTIQDVTNPKIKTVNSGYHYIVFKAKLISGFDDMCIDKQWWYWLHIPYIGFKRAWEKAPAIGETPVPNKVYDCRLSFIRQSKYKWGIVKKELFSVSDVLGYDSLP